jgi:NADPH-dependent curcumin reductase CurA
VQLGKKIAGCKVVGVVGSSHKVQTVYDLGADHVIDKSKEDLWGTLPPCDTTPRAATA